MLKVIISCIIILFCSNKIFSTPDYLIEVSNIERLDSKTIEFDIYIKSQSSQFELTSYQCVFSFNQALINSGVLSFSFIDATSQFSSLTPKVGIGINNSDGISKLTFASMPGSEFITSINKRVGKFKLTTNGSFNNIPLEIKWCFDGKINTILTGTNFDNITDSANHLEGSYEQLKIFNVLASSTSDTSTSAERTIDGKCSEDGDPDSRWASKPMPEYLIFDLGSTKKITNTKFSFYGWDEGRIYKYSVLTSNELTNWNEIITNDFSSTSEWTANSINKNARYVKLVFLSNNLNDWANLWEAQIYGNSDTTEIVNPNPNEKSQPLVNIPIDIGDGIGQSDTLYVGIDSTACDGLDACLGEVQFPVPPSQIFSAWLNIPNSQIPSLKDYRFGSKVNDFTYTYQVQYQRGTANKIIVHWNLPSKTKLKIQNTDTGETIDTVFNSGADSLTINNPNDIYRLNLIVTYLSNILPVELTSFKAEVAKSSVELNWKTATELNNKGFEIERKMPAKENWENIGFVKGNGTSTVPVSYKYNDDFKYQTIIGTVIYRLKQIDFDGTSKYSDEINVKVNLVPKEFVLYQNYPNPFNPSTNIKFALPFESNVNITIYNVLGEKVKEFDQGVKEAGNHDIVWTANNEASGVYLCTLIAKSTDGKNNYRKTQKMMLLK